MTSKPTLDAAERLAAAEPMLVGAGRLDAEIALPPRTLLHAGPPYRSLDEIPAVVRNAAAAAAVAEGWAQDLAGGSACIASGDIALAPAQDHGLVVPLAFVAGPGTGIITAACPITNAVGRAPINDGPPLGATRFGAPNEDAVARLIWLGGVAAPALDRALKADPIAMLPIAADALAAGDELHAAVGNGNAILQSRLTPALKHEDPAVAAYVAEAAQFFLNAWMASVACMLSAAAGIDDADLLVRAGANGVRVGFSISGAPEIWLEAPAGAPAGPPISAGVEHRRAAAAVGDSAVIEAAGFGALAAACAPDIVAAFRPYAPTIYARLVDLTVARHPVFSDLGLKVGVDAARISTDAVLPAHFAMLDATGTAGLIGRGAVILANRAF